MTQSGRNLPARPPAPISDRDTVRHQIARGLEGADDGELFLEYKPDRSADVEMAG